MTGLNLHSPAMLFLLYLLFMSCFYALFFIPVSFYPITPASINRAVSSAKYVI